MDVLNTSSLARVGAGADRRGRAQQLRYADEVIGRNRQRAAHQQVIGMDVGVAIFRDVVILHAIPRCAVQRAYAFVGGLDVVRLGTKQRHSQNRQ